MKSEKAEKEEGKTEKVIQSALEKAGIFHFGICDFKRFPLLPVRSASRLPGDARSVIVCLFPYKTPEEPKKRNLARYAVGRDYHGIILGLLEQVCSDLKSSFPSDSFVPFTDASPLPEVKAASLAGLGAVGKNSQLLSPQFGSFVFIGEIVTSLSLTPSVPFSGGCLNCDKCLKACPTGALAGNGTIDQSRCRSAITQKKGSLTEWEEEQLRQGGLLWGCDLCTDVCPMNQTALSTDIPAFAQDPVPYLTPKNLAEQHSEKACNYRPLSVLERNYRLLSEKKEK